MGNIRITTLKVALWASLLPAVAPAQSFWLHKQIFGSNLYGFSKICAVDSENSVFFPGAIAGANTTNHWNSWSYIFQDTAKRYNIDGEYSLTGVVYPSKELLIVACNAPKLKGNPPFPPGGTLLLSTNGGKIWTTDSLGSRDPAQPLNIITAIAALDDHNIAVLIDSDNNFSADHFLLSSDGGQRWHSISSPIFSVPGTSSGYPPNPVIAYPAPNQIMVASDGKIYRSTDLGITWDSVSRPSTYVTKFSFINPLIGFASGVVWNEPGPTLGAGIIDKTTDGGLTWSRVYSLSGAGLLSIAFADSLHGFACGYYGLIVQTTDGGNTWVQMTSDYTIDAQGNDMFSDIAYPDTNHAMIASSDGSVLVYQPDGLLSLPNITFPKFSPPSAPRTFDVTWDPVPTATRYSIMITTSGWPDSTTTLVLKDMNVTATSYHLSDLIDTTPGYSARNYIIYLQAFNATNQSNVATRTFTVVHAKDTTGGNGSNGIKLSQEDASVALYPDPASKWLVLIGYQNPVTVVDALGREHECPDHNGTLDISNLPAGNYYVSDSRHRAKFVKE